MCCRWFWVWTVRIPLPTPESPVNVHDVHVDGVRCRRGRDPGNALPIPIFMFIFVHFWTRANTKNGDLLSACIRFYSFSSIWCHQGTVLTPHMIMFFIIDILVFYNCTLTLLSSDPLFDGATTACWNIDFTHKEFIT